MSEVSPQSESSNLEPKSVRQMQDLWNQLRLPHFAHDHAPVKNANVVHREGLNALDRLALTMTNRVGSIGFFLVILVWTVIWTGYNFLASAVPRLGWVAFDPFPAFVAYLLMSNVIQILLMPLIMVGQNLQGRHAETRAQLDFEINQKAEVEILVVLHQLEHNTDLLLQLMRHLNCRMDAGEQRVDAVDAKLAETVAPRPTDRPTT
ncbi:MAG: hypothetical protein NVS2B7_25500 [Herpetosiphon sp.]